MKRLHKILLLGMVAAFLAVVALPASSSWAQEKDAMSKSSSASAKKLAQKSKTELAQINAKIKAYQAKINDPKTPAAQKKVYKDKLKNLKTYRGLIVKTMKNAEKCKDDSCYEQNLAVLNKVGVAADKVPEAAAADAAATPQTAMAAASTPETQDTQATNKGDALQTTVADATAASSVQTGGRIGGIDTGGSAPPSDPNTTGTSATDQASTTGETGGGDSPDVAPPTSPN